MSRITHFKSQPINIQYWDYYILCRLNTEATIALQRMEYWDGTKDAGTSHAEDINDMDAQAGKIPTQDTSSWIYKSQDELHWELMGIVGEKKVKELFRVLEEDLGYLKVRNNPHKGWDRKKQYEFEAGLIQNHVNYLGYIVSFFGLPLKRLRPIFYAIEALTRDEKYIELINVEMVAKKIVDFKEDQRLPHFLKNDIEKLGGMFSKPLPRSFRSFAEWKAQNCGMQSAESRNASRKTADSIPQNCGSNSIESKTEKTNHREDKQRESDQPNQQKPTKSRRGKSSSLSPQSSSQKSFSFDEVSPEAKGIFVLHDELEGYTVPRTERDTKDALELARCGVTMEDLRAVKEFILEDNAEWYEKHGIDLHALVVYYPKWKSAQAMKAITANRPPTQASNSKAGKVISSYDDDDYIDDTFYKQRTVTKKEEVIHATH